MQMYEYVVGLRYTIPDIVAIIHTFPDGNHGINQHIETDDPDCFTSHSVSTLHNNRIERQ